MKKVTSYQLPVTSYKKSRKGFTLVELIIYMGLLGIFLLVLTDIFVSMLNIKGKSEAISYVEQDARYMLSRLAYDINNIPANWTIDTPQNFGDTSNTFTYRFGFFPITYQENNGNLQLIYPPGWGDTNNLNSSETTISNLSFTKIGNPSGKETIKVQFTIESKTQTTTGPNIKTFTTTIGRR